MTHYNLSHCCGAKIYADDICSECREHCDPEYDQYPDPDTDPEAQDIKRMATNYPEFGMEFTREERYEILNLK